MTIQYSEQSPRSRSENSPHLPVDASESTIQIRVPAHLPPKPTKPKCQITVPSHLPPKPTEAKCHIRVPTSLQMIVEAPDESRPSLEVELPPPLVHRPYPSSTSRPQHLAPLNLDNSTRPEVPSQSQHLKTSWCTHLHLESSCGCQSQRIHQACDLRGRPLTLQQMLHRQRQLPTPSMIIKKIDSWKMELWKERLLIFWSSTVEQQSQTLRTL